MSPDEEALSQAIQNLAYTKKHTISDDALKAKASFEQHYDAQEGGGAQTTRWWQKRLEIIAEFRESVKLLVSVFQASSFDELALFISRPSRVLVINFCIGILRGIGFALGFFLVAGILVYLIRESLPPGFFTHLLILLRSH